MDNDRRYGSIKLLIESGEIKSIRDIFDYIPKTTVYKDLGINYNRFNRAIINPALFTLEELIVLAELFQTDSKRIIDLAYDQAMMVALKGPKKKKN